MAYEHRTGRVNSGDVTLFYRVFGKPGATPILILHGSNFYNSVDWIEVASRARDRPRGGGARPPRLGQLDLEPEQGQFARCAARRHAGGDGRDEVAEGHRHGPFRRRPDHHLVRGQLPADDREADPGRQPDEPRGKRAHRQVGRQPALCLRVGRGGDGEAQVLQSAALLAGTASGPSSRWSKSRRASCSSAIPTAATASRSGRARHCRAGRCARCGKSLRW